MNLKLAYFLVESMNSDSEIFDFIIESEFDLNFCSVAIQGIKDLEILDELMERAYYKSQDIFRIALETSIWRRKLQEISFRPVDGVSKFTLDFRNDSTKISDTSSGEREIYA